MRTHALVHMLLLTMLASLAACAPVATLPPPTPIPPATPTVAQAAPTNTAIPQPPTATFTPVLATTAPTVAPSATQPPVNTVIPSSTPRPPTATATRTNTPRPSPTAPVVASQPFDGGGIPQACFQFWQTTPTTRALMFRVIAYDTDRRPPPCETQKDGSGIAKVDFAFYKINANGGEVLVYAKPSAETNVPYCAFQDTNGVCNVWVLAEHGNRWPNNTPITNGDYVLRVKVTSKSDDTRNGRLNFTIKLP